MSELTVQEFKELERLLAKVQNRHFVMAILVRVVLEKYKGNKTQAARALDYTVRTMRLIVNQNREYQNTTN